MASLFARIIAGDIPCYKIKEDEYFFAFLDIMPQRAGHTLVVPKAEVDKIFDVSDSLLSKWLIFAKPIAKAIESAFDCDRCGISVIGLEVPHAHMHLVPISGPQDLNFTKKKDAATSEELMDAQQRILQYL